MILEENYLKGVIDAFISNYKNDVRDIPAESGLEYKFEYGIVGGENNPAAVRITFKWVVYGETKCIDEDTDSWETEQTPIDHYFTILGRESLDKLQEYVEETLEMIEM